MSYYFQIYISKYLMLYYFQIYISKKQRSRALHVIVSKAYTSGINVSLTFQQIITCLL